MQPSSALPSTEARAVAWHALWRCLLQPRPDIFGPPPEPVDPPPPKAKAAGSEPAAGEAVR